MQMDYKQINSPCAKRKDFFVDAKVLTRKSRAGVGVTKVARHCEEGECGRSDSGMRMQTSKSHLLTSEQEFFVRNCTRLSTDLFEQDTDQNPLVYMDHTSSFQ